MLRAAAKNFKHVTTIVHPADYNEVIERIKEDRLDEDFRKINDQSFCTYERI